MTYTKGNYRYKNGKIYKKVWWVFFKRIKIPATYRYNLITGMALIDNLDAAQTSKSYKTLIESVGKPKWIVNRKGRLGLRIFGVNLWYSNYTEAFIVTDGTAKGTDFANWRYMLDGEFGKIITRVWENLKDEDHYA